MGDTYYARESTLIFRTNPNTNPYPNEMPFRQPYAQA